MYHLNNLHSLFEKKKKPTSEETVPISLVTDLHTDTQLVIAVFHDLTDEVKRFND